MKVWILHAGWDVAADASQRLMRYGSLAKALAENGHQVVQWAPAFNHFTKKLWFEHDHSLQVSDGHEIRFVYAKGYSKNVSLQRFRFYRTLARRFREQAGELPQPDVIVAGIPSVEWCYEATQYGIDRQVPVVIDVRDLWPDVFLTAIPERLRKPGRCLLFPWFSKMKTACQNAAGICGVSQEYVNWGLRQAEGEAGFGDRVFPLGFSVPEAAESERGRCLKEIHDRGIDSSRLICLFSGQFEKSYDLETVIEAARKVETAAPGATMFVMCGEGSKSQALQQQAGSLRNIVFMGWCEADFLAVMNSISDVGLVAYGERALQSLPNKPFEYLSGGNALVSCLSGELPDIIRNNDCGYTYAPGDSDRLASILLQLASNPVRLQELKANSEQLFGSRYQMKNISSEFSSYLEQIVQQQPYAK